MANVMETQQQPPETVNTGTPEGGLALEGAATSKLPTLPSAKAPDTQWQRISKQILDLLDQLPNYIGSFFDKNKQAIFTLVLILSAFVTVKVEIAVLDAVNGVPLLAPIFEIIGIFYAIWFTFRYLIKAETRQELSHKVSSFKQQLLG
ncbi:CAAD domain-containing protein [Sphaerospermopsis aphanizomenoides BCCUSP55]|uniref:CAAD domain-containing protein n=1 Tax=Sphaerospermopsis aphanizomenoides TaxID=459663 RepID=UPI001906A21F|nr:CAAD domain-containing protein [Sphaerospermopsis aphanizomenoides]MBK1987818.1 CAAD domain-containing protein [Sphaerospermopsis aphanizomenoides BCCUSP55]